MKSGSFFTGLTGILILGSVSVASATPTVTIDGQPLPTPTPRPTSSGSTSNISTAGSSDSRFTYSDPFTVTIENLSGNSISQIFGRANSQLSKVLRAKCPKRSQLIGQSIQLNAGAVGAPSSTGKAPLLSGNGLFTLQCQTRNPSTSTTSSTTTTTTTN